MEDNAGIVNGLKKLYAVENGKKEEIYLKVMNTNKKKSRYLKVAAVAAALVLALPMTNYGQELITIVKEMATPSNRVQVVQERVNIDVDKTFFFFCPSGIGNFRECNTGCLLSHFCFENIKKSHIFISRAITTRSSYSVLSRNVCAGITYY